MYVKRQLTEDGFEMTWAVNHLGPFLLTTELLELLKASGHARVITTSSHGHAMARQGIRFEDLSAKGYYGFPGSWMGGPNFRYGETKLANILFTGELARRTAGTGITSACYDPGLVATNFNQHNGPLARLTMSVLKRFSVSPEQGAATLVWLADSDEMTSASGGYYKDQQRAVPAGPALDLEAARRLWEVSEQQVQASGG